MTRWCCLVIALLALGSGALAQVAEPVRVDGGLLTGTAAADPAVRVFKGVPFAAPPVGPLRWRPPQPVAPWQGVRAADRFGPSAMQADTGAFGPWTKEFIFGNAVSEDCLYLNVWTAAPSAAAKRPVLVYIHGGAFTGGSGEVAVYDGTALAKKGLVVVTINYRLGVFGFLAHPELSKESPQGVSGNYGLLDQVAALRWVQRNIAAFGGDPQRVTIAGQSAGAMSVHCLTASPLAKGLFQRAIAQSGSGVGRGVMRPRTAAEADGLTWAQQKSLAALRAQPAASLLAASPVRFGPVVDGWFLTDDIPATFARRQQNDVPTLTGLTADEGSFSPTYGKLDPAAFTKQARQRYGTRAAELLALYTAADQKESDRDQGRVSMALWAEQRARTARTPAYLYFFSRAIPWPQHPEYGAFHTSEVPYVFGTLAALDRPWEPADRTLSAQAMDYWVNFATHGDPNGPGLPRWPAYTSKSPTFLRFDSPIATQPLPAPEKRRFFTEQLLGTGLDYDRLVPGFVREQKNELGFAVGTAFAQPNPWGSYTAYRLTTDRRGLRTWRIENYVPLGNFMQGSTMYLLEGTERALLIDTAQETKKELGKTDLKTVVRYLLAHNDDGSPRTKPVDFVVANTHFHYDHTGENALMSDRTVYYPDLDWPKDAPTNYVPIREGGGPTPNGAGQAVGEIVLGGRTITAINLYGHTPGSQGYLDRDARFIVTGDALGSGVVWMHFGPVSVYADALHHLTKVLAPLDHPAVLPAHFYQITSGDRVADGKPLDKQYVADQRAAAVGTLAGTVIGEPYRIVGRNVLVATVGSAGMTYALDRLAPSRKGVGAYHAIRIPGRVGAGQALLPIDQIKSDFFLIRDSAGNSLYLLGGSERALLVGTGAGGPGLAAFVRRLVGSKPLAVIVTSDDPSQLGGLKQLAGSTLYVPRGSGLAQRYPGAVEVGQGTTLSLGTDSAGRPCQVQVEPLAGHSATGLTLLSVSDRVLLAGDALGMQTPDGGLALTQPLADFDAVLTAWRARTDGKYDTVYTARNHQWQTLPAFVDQLQSAVRRGLTDTAAWVSSQAKPGYRVVRSTGGPDIVASVLVR